MITAFLPCRKGSQRIPDKNIKDFAGVNGGLLKIKLDQLLRCEDLDTIIVSSNDIRVLDFASKYNEKRIVIDERPDHLGASSTTTDELIRYVPNLLKEGDVLWTHVTSPFLDESDYSSMISCYLEKKEKGFDSLMTAIKLQGFIWDSEKPISYDRSELKWPMTQNIKPFYELDSGAFIAPIECYRNSSDRIGDKPFIYEQAKLKSIDIDWPDDFELAETIWKNRG